MLTAVLGRNFSGQASTRRRCYRDRFAVLSHAMFSVDYRNSYRVLALALIALIFPIATGLQVADLYSHKIAVDNESNEERDRAITESFSAVVLKVTGDQRWLDHPAILQAARNAQDYVEAISYSSETILMEVPAQPPLNDGQSEVEESSLDDDELEPASTDSADTAEALTLTAVDQRFINVDFAARLVNELLATEEIAIWNSNRPSVLIWMVLQDEFGNRQLLSADNNFEIMGNIRTFAAERGLPVIFPVLDFEDRQNLSENEVWVLDEEVIRAASARYDADSILSGRLHFTAGGELVGLWQFIFQDNAETFDGFDENLQAYLYSPLDRVTKQLAGYFALVPEFGNQPVVRLRVEGIKNLSAYSALLSYVNNLGLVRRVSAAELNGEGLELSLSLFGNSDQLFDLISLDRDLLPIQSSLERRDEFLHYRWTR